LDDYRNIPFWKETSTLKKTIIIGPHISLFCTHLIFLYCSIKWIYGSDQDSHLWVWKISPQSSKFFNFSVWVKKFHQVQSKNTQVKDGSARYLQSGVCWGQVWAHLYISDSSIHVNLPNLSGKLGHVAWVR